MADPRTGPEMSEGVTVRSDLRPGDLGAIIGLHGTLYAVEYGFDPTFEAYVAVPLGEFARAGSERERIWIAESDGRLVGSVAIVSASPDVAQLRWFLVDHDARGSGLGYALLRAAISFSRDSGYRSIILWTVSALEAAAGLYRKAGFRRVEQNPGRLWGVDVIEEKYWMDISS